MLETFEALEQGTQEWHDLRAEHIRTASRTATVLNCNPFSKMDKLAQEIKFGIKPFYSSAMKQGNDLEDKVRDMANEHFGDVFVANIGINDGLLASLDGINFEGDTIIEIKVSNHSYKSLENKSIPLNYEWQVKHQMAVFDTVKKGYLFVYSPEKDDYIISDPILLNEEDKETIISAWNDFDKYLETYELPEMAEVKNAKALELAFELMETVAKKKELSIIESELKDKLQSYAKAEKTIIGNLTISKSKGRKTYDYSKIINELEVSDEILEKYVKESKESLTFRFSK